MLHQLSCAILCISKAMCDWPRNRRQKWLNLPISFPSLFSQAIGIVLIALFLMRNHWTSTKKNVLPFSDINSKLYSFIFMCIISKCTRKVPTSRVRVSILSCSYLKSGRIATCVRQKCTLFVPCFADTLEQWEITVVKAPKVTTYALNVDGHTRIHIHTSYPLWRQKFALARRLELAEAQPPWTEKDENTRED